MSDENSLLAWDRIIRRSAELRECQFCGSLACEWDGLEQLGCTDCGYEAKPQPAGLSAADRLALGDNSRHSVRV